MTKGLRKELLYNDQPEMSKHYYLFAALVLFAMTALSMLLMRKSEIGSVQKLVMEKIVGNVFLLSAIILLFTWGVQLLIM